MNRFFVVLAAASLSGLVFSAPGLAQGQSPAGYATPGASTDPSVIALRAEVAAMRAEVKETRRIHAEAKALLEQVNNRQQALYVQLANLSQSQVDKDTLLQSTKAEIQALNGQLETVRADKEAILKGARDEVQALSLQVQGARSELARFDQRLSEQKTEMAAIPAPAPVKASASSAGPSIQVPSPALDAAQVASVATQQCADLSRGTVATWQQVIPQILPEYAFEEIDRPNGRVWARKGQSSQGFIYNDVMRKIGCPV